MPAGARVLDVGCGPGWFWPGALARLPERLRLVLSDSSPAMVAAARARDGISGQAASLDVITAEAEALPFEDDSFDAVVSMHMLYHVAEPQRALAEMRRVLRPGGRVYVTTNAADNMAELGEIVASVFGGSPADRGGAVFSLNDAERLMDREFDEVRRHDLTEVMDVTDPADAVAYVLSMPPGEGADAGMRDRLARRIDAAAARTGGVLRITKRVGLVEGSRP